MKQSHDTGSYCAETQASISKDEYSAFERAPAYVFSGSHLIHIFFGVAEALHFPCIIPFCYSQRLPNFGNADTDIVDSEIRQKIYVELLRAENVRQPPNEDLVCVYRFETAILAVNKKTNYEAWVSTIYLPCSVEVYQLSKTPTPSRAADGNLGPVHLLQ